jgi:DNA-binding response OmpR family regulator
MLRAMASAPTHRVLLVDDDPVIVRLLEVNFRLEGYAIETATRGEEALEKAQTKRPDLIVLDVMMPGIDGWEVCRRLREDPTLADVPVIFLSARAQEDDRERGRALGVVDYLTKPFDPTALLETVRVHLGGAPGEPVDDAGR